MDGLHQGYKGHQGQGRDAGHRGFEHDTEGAELQADYRRGHRGDNEPAAGGSGACQWPKDQRISEEGREKTEVEDVASERQEATVGEEERLHR